MGVLAGQLALAAKHPTALTQGLFECVLHVVEAVLVDQRAYKVAFQWVANAHLGVGRLKPSDDVFFDRFMGDQTAQAGAALTGRANRTEQNSPYRHVQISAWAEDHGVIATQLKNAAGKTRGNFRRHFTTHAGAARRADQGHARIIDQGFAGFTATDDDLAQVLGRVAECAQHPIKQGLASQGREWGFLGGFPDHGIAAHQRQRGVPCPHRHRKVKRTDHPHYAQRMPGFTHVMAGPLGGDGQAIELA